MKKLVILTGIVFALVCSIPAFGQWHADAAIVEVPFEFVVGNTVLPAGAYAVRMDVQTHTLMLLNRDADARAVSLTHDIFLTFSGPAEASKLIFASNGQRPVLHQVVLKGENRIFDLIHGDEVAEYPGKPAT